MKTIGYLNVIESYHSNRSQNFTRICDCLKFLKKNESSNFSFCNFFIENRLKTKIQKECYCLVQSEKGMGKNESSFLRFFFLCFFIRIFIGGNVLQNAQFQQ